MTLDELIRLQPSMTRRFKSSAAGGYQIVHKTLQYLKRDLGLRGGQLFSCDLQDRLAYHLLRRRGYDDFISGKISRTEFGKNLAMEWASFPVLAVTKGASQKIRRGQSYYAGDALNKAIVTPAKVEAVLNKVTLIVDAELSAKNNKDIPLIAHVSELEHHPAKSKTVWTWILAAIGAIITEVGDTFGGLDWRVQLFICATIVSFALYGIKRRIELFNIFRAIHGQMNG